MIKKKSDTSTKKQLDQVREEYDKLHKTHTELEVLYNRSLCREQDLKEQLQQEVIAKQEAERKLSLLVSKPVFICTPLYYSPKRLKRSGLDSLDDLLQPVLVLLHLHHHHLLHLVLLHLHSVVLLLLQRLLLVHRILNLRDSNQRQE